MRDPAAPTAVRHTTRRGAPFAYDLPLFLADKLSWDQEGTPPLAQTIADAWQRGSAAAPPAHIRYVRSHGMVLVPHGWLLEAERRPQTEA